MKYFDPCILNPQDKLEEKCSELGWENPAKYSTCIIKADGWGELKRKIRKNREGNAVVTFSGGNEKLNRKAVTQEKIDILLHPEKGRRDSGLDEPTVRNSSSNNVAIGLDFSNIPANSKKRTQLFSKWKKNLRLCEKYSAPYIITTGAKEKRELRGPRDLKALVGSIGFDGTKAFKNSEKIVAGNT